MTREQRTKWPAVMAIAIAGLLSLSICAIGQPLFAAYAQESCPDCSKEQIIESLYSGPVHLDSFWTTSASSSGSENLTSRNEVEVGPGDGASTLAVVLVNRGPADISGVIGYLSLPEGFKATGKPDGEQAVASFNQIAKVGTPFVLFFDVDVLDSASVREYSTNLKVDYSRYFESGVPRGKDITVPFRITGEPILTVGRGSSDGGVTGDSQIAAGSIEEFAFDVSNDGTAPITNVVVTMVSQSESLEILGDSKWTIQRIDENSKVSLSTQIFAARPLIGNPASFDVTVEYSSNGISSSETFKLGTYVEGEISITAYEIEVTDIGGTPNVVGNLLNEGNTVALFTTIELVDAGNLVADLPPQQYLGDLEENSPLPFSIPVDVGNAGAGTYPISLKVTYKDNLRQLHTLDVKSDVVYVPETPADESAANPGMDMVIPVGIGAAIAAAIATVVLVRRRKRTALKRTITERKHDDMDFLLDSQQRVEKRTEDRK
ncbi:MAG: hypothetical protein MN733_26840 [Nitrososphaera sp.]|nr:hypothetical protein [Nitrososphaera sp.]